MKFHPDKISAPWVQGYGPGWIQVAGKKITHSIVIITSGERMDWHETHYEALTAGHFEQLARMQTELVIFGSGPRLRFVSPALTQALMIQRIGLETMDTQAACRTYNILAAEGRHVAVALLMR